MGKNDRIWLIFIGLEPPPRLCLMVGISWYHLHISVFPTLNRFKQTSWNTPAIGAKVTCCFFLQKRYLSERGSKDVRKRCKNRFPFISHDRFFHPFSFSILNSHHEKGMEKKCTMMLTWKVMGKTLDGQAHVILPLNAGSLGHQIMTLSWEWWKARDSLVISPGKSCWCFFCSFFPFKVSVSVYVKGCKRLKVLFGGTVFPCLTSVALNCLGCFGVCSLFHGLLEYDFGISVVEGTPKFLRTSDLHRSLLLYNRTAQAVWDCFIEL